MPKGEIGKGKDHLSECEYNSSKDCIYWHGQEQQKRIGLTLGEGIEVWEIGEGGLRDLSASSKAMSFSQIEV